MQLQSGIPGSRTLEKTIELKAPVVVKVPAKRGTSEGFEPRDDQHRKLDGYIKKIALSKATFHGSSKLSLSMSGMKDTKKRNRRQRLTTSSKRSDSGTSTGELSSWEKKYDIAKSDRNSQSVPSTDQGKSFVFEETNIEPFKTDEEWEPEDDWLRESLIRASGRTTNQPRRK